MPNFVLSHSGVYTKEEVLKVFKCKMSKLQLLYKKQLSLINDKLIYDRRKYLELKKGEKEQNVTTSTSSQLGQSDFYFNSLTDLHPDLINAAKKYKSNTKKVSIV